MYGWTSRRSLPCKTRHFPSSVEYFSREIMYNLDSTCYYYSSFSFSGLDVYMQKSDNTGLSLQTGVRETTYLNIYVNFYSFSRTRIICFFTTSWYSLWELETFYVGFYWPFLLLLLLLISLSFLQPTEIWARYWAVKVGWTKRRRPWERRYDIDRTWQTCITICKWKKKQTIRF